MLNQVESSLTEAAGQDSLDANLRCWISMLQDEKKPPSSLMLNSVRVFIAPPQSIKENMLRSFSWIDSDQVRLSNKSEWPILLHNLTYFHSCLKLRSRYVRCGWNSPYSLQFSLEEFLVIWILISVQKFKFKKHFSNINRNRSGLLFRSFRKTTTPYRRGQNRTSPTAICKRNHRKTFHCKPSN